MKVSRLVPISLALTYRDATIGPHNLIAMKCRCVSVFFLLFVLSACAENNLGEKPSLKQMGKANGDVEELNPEFATPPQDTGADACITRESISDRERRDLIQRLEAAKTQDDHNEQEMLNIWWTEQPARTTEFDQQKQLVDSVVRDIEIGQIVCWSKVEEALKVPAPPY
jgi:hypothetical protein